MNFSSFTALRYINSTHKNYYFSWITILSILGIAIGIGALILVISLMNGFEKELRDRFLAANAHILIFRYPSGVENHTEVSEFITKKSKFRKKVKGVSPFVHYETIAKKGSLTKNVLVRGIDPLKRSAVQDLQRFIKPSGSAKFLYDETLFKSKVKSVIIGSGLQDELNIEIGDFVKLISPDTKNISVFEQFQVQGIYDSGLDHYDGKLVLMNVPTAQKFFNMGKRVTGLEIGLHDPNDSIGISKQIKKKMKIQTKPWQSFNKAIFNALEMERAVIAMIAALVALVASFNIFTTLFVSVSQKRRDISVFKSLGARNAQVLWMFLKQGAIIGLIGALLGVGFSYLFAKALVKYQFIKLPDLYYVTKLPMEFSPAVYIVITLCGIIICLLAGLYPAWLASKQDPASGFRNSLYE